MEASESDSEQASTCQGSHCETDPRPKPKQTKVSGKAATKFNRAWSRTYPFIVGMEADQFKFLCTICQRQIACEKGMWRGTLAKVCIKRMQNP